MAQLPDGYKLVTGEAPPLMTLDLLNDSANVQWTRNVDGTYVVSCYRGTRLLTSMILQLEEVIQLQNEQTRQTFLERLQERCRAAWDPPIRPPVGDEE